MRDCLRNRTVYKRKWYYEDKDGWFVDFKLIMGDDHDGLLNKSDIGPFKSFSIAREHAISKYTNAIAGAKSSLEVITSLKREDGGIT